jgi:FtsP/CotA-like multicopper oxidase with cupredoxin domain
MSGDGSTGSAEGRPRVRMLLYAALGLTVALLVSAGTASAVMTAKMGGQSSPLASQARMMTPEDMLKHRVTSAQRKADARALAQARQRASSSLLGRIARLFASSVATFDPQGAPDYMGGVVPNYANSQLPATDASGLPVPGTGIRKFVDSLPGLGYANRNNLGQYIPVAAPDTTTYPGCDYYEIALVQYQEKLGSDIPTTTLRGYVQENTTDTTISRPNYLGPMILAQEGRPVRVKFTNRLPIGSDGDLFIPTDTSAMGAGMGPNGSDMYTQNRATLHLHGGNTPWISDGTPHQWTTPAGESTPYPKGVSVSYVPDMWYDASGTPVPSGTPDATNNPGPGAMTFYYTNQQSARLMFYHDHSYGITRLNVYAGEAAPYLLQDPIEQTLANGGTFTGADGATVTVAPSTIPTEQVPLVIQDKTFVPSDTQLLAEDPTWDRAKWGSAGSLWFPHVYMPNQRPGAPTGANAMGRWDYGPWFWPPLTADAGLVHGPTAQGDPGTPNPSMVPEAFLDTPLVNGTAYPYLKVQRKAYRFRILNASNDRTLNLSLFYAASNTPAAQDAQGRPTLQTSSGEVPMVPAVKRQPYAPQSPIYRLYDIHHGTHLYTASLSERARLLAIRPRQYTNQVSPITYAASSPANSHPLFRFTNKKGHFWVYTTSISYAAKLKRNKAYHYDGVAWKVATSPGPGRVPVYRFYNTRNGDSYFTISPQEKNDYINRVPHTSLQYRGIVCWLAKTGGPTVGGWPASWPSDGRDGGVPEPMAAGPAMVQIGTEGGLLPAPVVITPQPIGYNYNRRDIVVLNLSDHSLLLGPAERADVIVDFSGVPDGSKLILYNDAPAPVPAFDSRYDYYTGDQDQTETGGAPSTLAGYGPNTRTVMQLQVGGPVGQGVNLPALQAAIPAAFKASQPALIVPEKAYGAATDTYVRIEDTTLTYTPENTTTPVALPLRPKAIQELFELEYGRMNATLGVERPFTNFNTQTTIPLGYLDPATEDIVDSASAVTSPGADGTQIWKITHNGVDTHAIHFHLFNVQVINRVGWDGAIRPPDDNELGWKETVRMNPLEDCIVALRPVAPSLPFKIGDSIRPLDPTRALGATMTVTSPDNGNLLTVHNYLVNFGWEYVWHCHLLGHEENDMMRPMIFRVSPAAPSTLTVVSDVTSGTDLTWVDNSSTPAATNFLVQRADDAGFSTGVVETSVAEPAVGWNDTSAVSGNTYHYRVRAENVISYSEWSSPKSVTLP